MNIERCKTCGHKVRWYNGKSTGFIGILNVIRWRGIIDWIQISKARKCFADEAEVYEALSGN
jgi:hypothetical protein